MRRKASLDSVNSPLRIDQLDLPNGGAIGMTLCPGKKIINGRTGDWDRNLELDLQKVAEWHAIAVLSLMGRDEFSMLKVTGLGQAVEARGMDWHHLPIPDVSIPDGPCEDLWVYSGHRLRCALASGRRVLIHCRGGLGRTGLMAGRLLVEMGEQPANAIARVRAARPGTIETMQQEKYVLSLEPLHIETAVLDRILGCLIGGTVGDAMGYSVEFDSWRTIRARFGAQGICEPVLNNGQSNVSDDTQMTLFTLEGLLQSRDAVKQHRIETIVESIRLAYLDWFATQNGNSSHILSGKIASDRRLQHRRAPGNTCMSAMAAGGRGRIENPLNHSKGCGGAMRVAPIGLLPGWRPEETAELAARASALTHGHPSGYLSAGAMAAMVRLALEGIELAQAAKQSREIVSRNESAEETVRAIDSALSAASGHASDHREVIGSLGQGGWCGEDALAIGLYSALVGHSFPEVLSIAANHDGDSDSTASIAGQLYGVSHGLGSLPNRWIRRLDVLDVLLGLVRQTFL